MCNMLPFLHCVREDMKVTSWFLPFYCIAQSNCSSSQHLKPCHSEGTKWQPSRNWITGRTGSQESPSPDWLAKWSDCPAMSWVLRWRFPLQFLQTHSNVLAFKDNSSNVFKPCPTIKRILYNLKTCGNPQQVTHSNRDGKSTPTYYFLFTSKVDSLETVYSMKINHKSNTSMLTVLERYANY